MSGLVLLYLIVVRLKKVYSFPEQFFLYYWKYWIFDFLALTVQKLRLNQNYINQGHQYVDIFYFIFYFYLYIYSPDSQESDVDAIHRVSNYPDLLPEMPRYCCPLVI